MFQRFNDQLSTTFIIGIIKQINYLKHPDYENEAGHNPSGAQNQHRNPGEAEIVPWWGGGDYGGNERAHRNHIEESSRQERERKKSPI